MVAVPHAVQTGTGDCSVRRHAVPAVPVLGSFIAPGLYNDESAWRSCAGLQRCAVLLGAAFAYFVVFPGFPFLVGVTQGVVMTDIMTFSRFVAACSFAFGLAFEVPMPRSCWCLRARPRRRRTQNDPM